MADVDVSVNIDEFLAVLDETLKKIKEAKSGDEAWDSGFRTGLQTAAAMVSLLLTQRYVRSRERAP